MRRFLSNVASKVRFGFRVIRNLGLTSMSAQLQREIDNRKDDLAVKVDQIEKLEKRLAETQKHLALQSGSARSWKALCAALCSHYGVANGYCNIPLQSLKDHMHDDVESKETDGRLKLRVITKVRRKVWPASKGTRRNESQNN